MYLAYKHTFELLGLVLLTIREKVMETFSITLYYGGLQMNTFWAIIYALFSGQVHDSADFSVLWYTSDKYVNEFLHTASICYFAPALEKLFRLSR